MLAADREWLYVVVPPQVAFRADGWEQFCAHALSATRPRLYSEEHAIAANSQVFPGDCGNGVIKIRWEVCQPLLSMMHLWGNVVMPAGLPRHSENLGVRCLTFEPHSGLRGEVSGAKTKRSRRVVTTLEHLESAEDQIYFAVVYSKSPPRGLNESVAKAFHSFGLSAIPQPHLSPAMEEELAPWFVGDLEPMLWFRIEGDRTGLGAYYAFSIYTALRSAGHSRNVKSTHLVAQIETTPRIRMNWIRK